MPKRSLTLYESAIKSPETLKIYMYSLNEFMEFIKIKDFDAIPKLGIDTIQTHLENWVMHLADKGLKSSSIRGKLSAVELFLEMNKVIYHKKILRKLIPSSDYIQGGEKPFTTEDIQKFLKSTTKLRTKAFVLFLTSTGMRPAGIVDPILKLKHIEDMPNDCKAVRIYDGSREGYWAFLTPEASKALDNYLNSRKRNGEELTPESPVFTNSERPHKMKKNLHMSEKSAKQMMQRLILTAGVERTKQGNRYDKASIYGFRKRFNTVLKLNNDVNSNVAEKLMAHKKGLDGTYLQPTKEECFKEFSKAIEQLTIDSSIRQEIRLKQMEVEQSEIEQIKSELRDNKQELNQMAKIMNIMQSKGGVIAIDLDDDPNGKKEVLFVAKPGSKATKKDVQDILGELDAEQFTN
ncbi:MAG: tyrosine-type recombinase/integrase [Candidatus Nitrosopumilus sp. bin_7KS]